MIKLTLRPYVSGPSGIDRPSIHPYMVILAFALDDGIYATGIENPGALPVYIVISPDLDLSYALTEDGWCPVELIQISPPVCLYDEVVESGEYKYMPIESTPVELTEWDLITAREYVKMQLGLSGSWLHD